MRELLDADRCEAVEKRLWESLSPTALLKWVLCRKDPKGWRAHESLAELGDENLCAVVQAAVEPFQDALRR
jgi:hypothetical protein